MMAGWFTFISFHFSFSFISSLWVIHTGDHHQDIEDAIRY
jgi:hypothetical protein